MGKKIAPLAALAAVAAAKGEPRRKSATHNFREIPTVTGEVVNVKETKGRFESQARVALKTKSGEAAVCFLPLGYLSLAEHIGSTVTINREVKGDDFTGREIVWTVEEKG